MRIFKFRIWDSVNKKFSFFKFPDTTMVDSIAFNSGVRYIYQQSTGVFDCSDLEIYEGDIVDIFDLKSDLYLSRVEVIYSERDAYFKIAAANSLSYYIDGYFKIKVVRNIFQDAK